MTVHTRERKRIWCRLFGHGEPVMFWSPFHTAFTVLCVRCGSRLP